MDPERIGGTVCVTIASEPDDGPRREVLIEVEAKEWSAKGGDPMQEAAEGAIEEAMATLFRKEFKCEQIGE